jgi:ATP-binding cassette subfamily C protein LapB
MRHDHGPSFPEPSAPRADPFNPGTEAGSAASANGLLEALVHVARVHGLSPSADAILSAVAADPEGLTLAALEEAAGGLGLRTHVARLSWRRIPQVSLPAIVFDADGRAVVLTGVSRASGVLEIVAPAAGSAPHTVEAGSFGDGGPLVCVFLAPASGGGAGPGETGAGAVQRGHWFWSAVRRLWPDYLQVVVAALIGNLLGLATPLFVMNVYDRVIPNLAIPTLWALTAGVVLALLMDFALKILRTRIVDDAGRRVDMAVAGRMYDRILAMRLEARAETTGAMANRIRDLDTVRDVLTSSTVIAMTDLLFIGVFLWVMWVLVGPLAAIPALAVPLVLIVTGLVQIPLAGALRASQTDTARRQSLVVETLFGLETVKAAGAEGVLRRAFDRAVAVASRSTARARGWANLAASFTALVFQGVSILIVVFGVFLVVEGRITIGALIAANILAGRVLAPLGNISQTLARLHQARAALQGLEGLMTAPPERARDARVHAHAKPCAPAPDAVEAPEAVGFQRVSFTYPGTRQPALDGVSFSIARGERVGIIGRVGSGKSTLARLIGGLYDPTGGTCLLHGTDARQYAAATLRREVGVCLQDAELFTGTLGENIAIGRPFATEADLERAVRLSGVAAFAAHHPLGLDLPVAEHGRNLSGGQRQAVALARCLIRRPGIVFLDEPTSAMDVSSERAVCANLKTLAAEGVTLLIATHRDGPLDLVDRLLVFEAGRLVMDGPKAEVLGRLRGGGEGAR